MLPWATLGFSPGGIIFRSVANAINVLQAYIYKSVKQAYFLNHLWPQVLSNSTLACFSANELGI